MAIAASDNPRLYNEAEAGRSTRLLPISGFGAGTLITTVDGVVPVDWLRPGDKLVTLDGGIYPVRWIGRDCLRYPSDTVLAAELRTKADCAGKQKTLLAARHRVVLTGWQVQLNFGLDAVLAEAVQIAPEAVYFPRPKAGSSACSLVLLSAPQIIQADGYWVETLQLTDRMFDCLTETARDEVRRTQPEMDKHRFFSMPRLRAWEATDLKLDLEGMLAHDKLQLGVD